MADKKKYILKRKKVKSVLSLGTLIIHMPKMQSILRITDAHSVMIAEQQLYEIASRSYRLPNFEQNFKKFPFNKQKAIALQLGQIHRLVYDESVNFKKEYIKLSSEEKNMALLQILNLYHYGCGKNNHRISEKEKSIYWNKIRTAMAIDNVSIDHKVHTPLDKGAKKVIRWDAYGLLEKPKSSDLSDEYKNFRKTAKSQHKNSKHQTHYDLYTSPAWAYNFAQFYNFYKSEPMVQKALNQLNIPPSLLPRLNVFDYADIIYEFCGDKNYGTAKLFSGSKFEFVKTVGTLCENEIIAAHQKMGVDERYTLSLLREMKRFGVSSNVTPLECICTEEALHKLTKAGIDCSNLKPGDTYPEAFYDLLFASDAYKIIIAKDRFGNDVKGPAYDVDHQDPVDDAGGKRIADFSWPNLQATNSRTRYRLVDQQVHQLYIHAKDTIQADTQTESYVSRVKIPDENIVIMFGVDKDSWITHDFSDDRYVIEQNRYFYGEYIHNIVQAEACGKISYTVQNLNAQNTVTKIKNKKKDTFGNIRFVQKSIARNRRR